MTQKPIEVDLYPWEHAIFDMLITRISWAVGGNLCYAASATLSEEGGQRYVESQALHMVANIENQRPLLTRINIDMLNNEIDKYEWVSIDGALSSAKKVDGIKRKGEWTDFAQWWNSLEAKQQDVFREHGLPSLRTGLTQDGLTMPELLQEAGLKEVKRDHVKFYVAA